MIDPHIITALSRPEDAARRGAAQEIGESDDPSAGPILLNRLQVEQSRAVKEAILRGLSRIWGSSPVEAMIELLRDKDPFVRAEAAGMLQKRAGDAIESLEHLLHGDDKDLRKFSIDILGQSAVGVPDVLYLAALEDADVNVVISTVENIGAGRRMVYADRVLEVALANSRPGAMQPMLLCACMDTLALIGTAQTLAGLRARFPVAGEVPGLFLQPFLKLLGTAGGPAELDEICAVIKSKGPPVYAVAVDAASRIVARHPSALLDADAETLFCDLLAATADLTLRFHLLRLLGHFTASPRVAGVVLAFIHDPNRQLGMAAVEALGRSSDPAVETALALLLSSESDPEIEEELEEILGRRARWNSPLNSSPN